MQSGQLSDLIIQIGEVHVSDKFDTVGIAVNETMTTQLQRTFKPVSAPACNPATPCKDSETLPVCFLQLCLIVHLLDAEGCAVKLQCYPQRIRGAHAIDAVDFGDVLYSYCKTLLDQSPPSAPFSAENTSL